MRGGTSSEGLPIGVQIVARPWREDVALAVAYYLEAALKRLDSVTDAYGAVAAQRRDPGRKAASSGR